ncbi:MAG TPA: hypothetical protein VMF06_02370 [Candidatus Limnocylindria bacterium]|jgi:hypothetical protein|nr:hypothetical protein [Candidatus Limnocylindria bacterium]
MDRSLTILVAINLLCLGVVIWLKFRIGGIPPLASGDLLVLRHPKVLEILGWISSISTCGAFAYYLIATPGTIRTDAAIVLGGSVFLLLYLTRITRVHSFSYSDELIHYQPSFGAGKSFRWGNITNVNHSELPWAWVFLLDDGKKFGVSSLMSGHVDFLVKARGKLGLPIQIPGYR